MANVNVPHGVSTYVMVRDDPYKPRYHYYECLVCSYRETTESHIASCPKCTGEMHNIAVARE